MRSRAGIHPQSEVRNQEMVVRNSRSAIRKFLEHVMHFSVARSWHRFAAVRGSRGILPVGTPGILPGVSALRQRPLGRVTRQDAWCPHRRDACATSGTSARRRSKCMTRSNCCEFLQAGAALTRIAAWKQPLRTATTDFRLRRPRTCCSDSLARCCTLPSRSHLARVFWTWGAATALFVASSSAAAARWSV